jgi:RNA polymerase sigma-70 factor (ECF subfamily)
MVAPIRSRRQGSNKIDGFSQGTDEPRRLERRWRVEGPTMRIMPSETDAELLEAWTRDRCARAFTELVRRYERACLGHARALLGAGGSAEDCVQDTFCRLATQPPKLDPELRADPKASRSVLAAWLHQVTRNRALDILRSEKRRRRREALAAADEATAGGAERVEQEDTVRAVERGLERLPEAQREVLVLRLVGERSYREIAEITGRKVGTVGWLISEGLKALSHELAHLVSHEPEPGSGGAGAIPGAAQ